MLCGGYGDWSELVCKTLSTHCERCGWWCTPSGQTHTFSDAERAVLIYLLVIYIVIYILVGLLWCAAIAIVYSTVLCALQKNCEMNNATYRRVYERKRHDKQKCSPKFFPWLDLFIYSIFFSRLSTHFTWFLFHSMIAVSTRQPYAPLVHLIRIVFI